MCNKQFTRRQALNSHKRTWHEKIFYLKFFCELCKEVFSQKDLFDDHLKRRHEKSLAYKQINSAFDDKFVRYQKYFTVDNTKTPNVLLNKHEIAQIAACLFYYMQNHPWIKYNIVLSLLFGQFSLDGHLVGNEEFFSPSETETLKLSDKYSVLKSVRNHCVEVTNRFEDILFRGSGWNFLGVKYCDITIVSLEASTSYQNPLKRSL